MPKRVLDFDALWASDKIAACAEWAQAEYAWLYGMADANGSFELTNLRVPWSKASAIRKNFPFDRFERVIDEFHGKGLLFIWTENGKRYGHWTGSDKAGRLPRESRRTERYGRILAPPVPKDQLQTYATHCASQSAKDNCDSNSVAQVGGNCDSNPVVGLGLGVGIGVGVGEKQRRSAPAATASAAQPVAFRSSLFVVNQSQDAKLADTYPWVDRSQEYKKMALWCEANRPRRKVRNALALCQNWFNRIPKPTNGNGGMNGNGNRNLSFAERRSQANAAAIDTVCGRLEKESGDPRRALPPANH